MHYAKHHAVVVAFNAKNLKPVAESISKKYPETNIIIAADNDINTTGNPGLAAGKEVAAIVGAKLIYPSFKDKPFTGSDFNDYYGGSHDN